MTMYVFLFFHLFQSIRLAQKLQEAICIRLGVLENIFSIWEIDSKKLCLEGNSSNYPLPQG